MKKLDYNRIVKSQPTVLAEISNAIDQEVVFVEDPDYGDCAPVIALFHKEKIAVKTDFYDCEDMTDKFGDCTPALMFGEVKCQWEFDLNK